MHHSIHMSIEDSTNSAKVLHYMRRTAPKRLAEEASFQSQHIVFSQLGIAATIYFTVHLCAAPTYLRVASISLEYSQTSNAYLPMSASLHRYNIGYTTSWQLAGDNARIDRGWQYTMHFLSVLVSVVATSCRTQRP